jgi:hypothetical protein
MPLQGGLSIEHICQLVGVSRRSFNHKRVARIMREDNLLGTQPKRFVVTTNSNHKL